MFATAPIEQGQIVNVWGGTVLLTENDIEGRKAEGWRAKGYVWSTIGEGLYLARLLSKGETDLTDLINHSCDPNVWMQDEVTLAARRDIAVGEELTIDYAMFEGSEDWAGRWKCQCGSELCREIFTGQDWRRKDLQARYQDHFSPFINKRISREVERTRLANLKQVVQEGYDRIAEKYIAWVESDRSETRTRYTQVLLDGLPPGASVLDLGCGAGGPTTRALAGRFDVTGIDISAQSIALARQNVPGARFIESDMADLDLPPGSFDGVVAFYSTIHVPRQEQPALLARIASWLRPGGLMVMTMGIHSIQTDYDEDFLGVPMYWSSFDAETNERLVTDAGLQIVSAQQETEEEDGQAVTFLWIVARKPESTKEKSRR